MVAAITIAAIAVVTSLVRWVDRRYDVTALFCHRAR
jgi:hypothetical protein